MGGGALRGAGFGRSPRAPLRVLGVDHVQLAQPRGGEAAARSFYGDLLGLRELPKPAARAASGGVWFDAGAVQLHLGVVPEFRPARKAHSGLLVEGLDELAAALVERDLPVEFDGRLPGHQRLFTSDPFGNRAELLERCD